MKKRIIITLLFLRALAANGQDIDSLKRLLKDASEAWRCDLLYELSYAYIDIDNYSALKYGRDGFRLSAALSDSARLVKTGRVYASALRRLHSIDSSIYLYRIILPMAR